MSVAASLMASFDIYAPTICGACHTPVALTSVEWVMTYHKPYCSHCGAHFGELRVGRVKRCEGCTELFVTQAGHPGQRWCSHRCKGDAQRKGATHESV